MLGSKAGNEIECDDSSDDHNRSKSNCSSSSNNQAKLEGGTAEASKYQSSKVANSKELIHIDKENNKQNGHNLSIKNLSSELINKVEEETKREDSKNTTTSRNTLQHVDEEEQAEKSFVLSQHSEVKEEGDSWQHYFTAFDIDIEVFESAKDGEDIDDIYDENEIDDYLRLMRMVE